MQTSLEDFFTRLNLSRSADETWRETLAFQRSLGFERVMYGYSCPSAEQGGIDVRMLSNYADWYHDRYREQRYHHHDPVVLHCIHSLNSRMIGIDSLHLWPSAGGLSPIQRRITEEAAESGLRIGLVFPLRAPGPSPLAGMSLGCRMTLRAFERLVAERGREAHLAAAYAHARLQMQRVDHQPADVCLTERERECLLWTSQGLSSKQVARRLGISFKTVEFHIANAMRKLQSATRSQAVARAIALGAIQP